MSVICKVALAVLFLFLFFSTEKCSAQKVYAIEDTSQADILIFVTPDSMWTDLFAFEVASPGAATQVGLWFFAQSPQDAEYTVSIINDPNRADIIIQFIQDPLKISWANNKEYLFNK